MGVADVIDITITRQSVVPTQDGFGYANFVSAQAAFTPKIKAYSSIAEITADSANAGADSVAFANVYFGQALKPSKLYVTKKGSDAYDDALSAASLVDDNWYGVAIPSVTESDILDVAAWVNARVKIFCAKTNDTGSYDNADTTDILSQLADLGYDRTFVFFHETASTLHIQAAPFGLQFPKNPGSSNWAYKRLQGVAASALNDTQRSNLLGKLGNCLTTRNGYNVFENGRMVSGEWIDIIHGIDWLHARMETNIFTAYVNNEKIPFTDDGIQLVVAQIDEALAKGVERGILKPGYTISAPRAASVSATDRGNRTLPDIAFEAYAAGAINKSVIRGRVLI